MRVKPENIIKTFKETNSVSSIVRILGVHRSTIYRWIRRAKSPYGHLKHKESKREFTKPKTIHNIFFTFVASNLLFLKFIEKKNYQTRNEVS